MRIEQLIAQHFYKNREVTLQGIGTFKLSPDIIISQDNDKDIAIPSDAVLFEYDEKATEDIELINYIVQQTKKLKSLAAADLDSYLSLGKQFINIGKPFTIKGLGTLLKNQKGTYEFITIDSINTKAEADNPTLKEKPREEISFRSISKKTSNKKNVLIAILVFAILFTSIVVWYFLQGDKISQKNNKDAPNKSNTTLSIKNDSVKNVLSNNSSTNKPAFKVVIREYSNFIAADNYVKRLTSYGHNLILYTKDSTLFKVAMPFNTSLKDTSVIKDSLKRYIFGGNPYIEF